jgi:MoaA/NifB/PqqE/SkfB family radical SAM enzyme
MLDALKRELHYQYRSLRLARGFLRQSLIHCNLQITYRCNFSCRICDFWKTPHHADEELTVAQIRTIGEKLNDLGTMIISLAGGEPLIRDDIFEIITALNETNHFPILITNGWFVDEVMAKKILSAGLQEISVSVDYADPARHDAQRGMKGSWDRAIRALELLNRFRPDRRNRVHMISVIMDDNLDDIEDLIKLARSLGVTYMANLYSWNRGTKTRRIPDVSVSARLLELKRRYPEFITLTSYIERIDQAIAEGGIGNCRSGELYLNINNRGEVARCTETLDEPVGNLLDTSAREIYRRLRRLQRTQPCAQCWTSCRGFAESMFQPPRLRQLREFINSVRPYEASPTRPFSGSRNERL